MQVRIVDLHAPTRVLEEAGNGCHDMRHYQPQVYDQLSRVLMHAVCAPHGTWE